MGRCSTLFSHHFALADYAENGGAYYRRQVDDDSSGLLAHPVGVTQREF